MSHGEQNALILTRYNVNSTAQMPSIPEGGWSIEALALEFPSFLGICTYQQASLSRVICGPKRNRLRSRVTTLTERTPSSIAARLPWVLNRPHDGLRLRIHRVWLEWLIG